MRRNKLFVILVSVPLSLLFPAMHARGQSAPPQFFWVCYSAANEANIYVSGVLQGPATSGAAFRGGFVQTLAQRYSYKGNAACVLARTAAEAQNGMNARATAWRNAKKNVVETGWTEAAPAASGAAGAVTNPLGNLLGGTPSAPAVPAAPASSGQATSVKNQVVANSSGATAPQGGASTGGDSAASILATLFGGSPAPAAGSGGTAAAKAPQGQTAGKTTGASGTAAGASANPGAVNQVASTLSSIFGKGSGGGAPGGAGNSARPETPAANGPGGKGAGGAPAGAPAPNASTPGGLPQGALGSAQFSNTMLVVYGCGRQGTDGTQVLCLTDLTNQNPKDTLVQGAAAWKDAFIVDDRGDRHTRTNGYFLNIDGEQRQQLDIDNGKSAHFILAFDGVPAKVEKITLRSATGGLNVAGIPLIAVGATDASAQAQPQPAPAH